MHSWGEPGSGPSQFILPHFVDVDAAGTVYVCDRENMRIQVFSGEGEYLTEWPDLNKPADIHIDREQGIAYVGQLGDEERQPRISIHDLKGTVLSSWEGREREGKGVLAGPHGIGVDSHGNIYEGAIGDEPRIQKFARTG